jgi:hypothetical protein
LGGSAGGSAAVMCEQAAGLEPVFLKQAFGSPIVPPRELYSWTTDAQAAALRVDQVLFTQTGEKGLGTGYAIEYLRGLALDQSVPERAQLAGTLSNDLFAKPRYAWGEPWATRMGWPGEDYGGNLLRFVLKAEAWVVLVQGNALNVVDMAGAPVTTADALGNPARIGAIFFQRDGVAGGPECGSFIGGGNGYREFILGNLAMIEEWSMGTEQIRDRLSENIAQLTEFLNRTRACPVTRSAQDWNLQVSCSWNSRVNPPVTEIFAYEQALAMPSANYLAVPDRLVQMIETLQGDLFQVDPLVVLPGSK